MLGHPSQEEKEFLEANDLQEMSFPLILHRRTQRLWKVSVTQLVQVQTLEGLRPEHPEGGWGKKRTPETS